MSAAPSREPDYDPLRAHKPIGSYLVPERLMEGLDPEDRAALYIVRGEGTCLEPEVHDGDHAIVAPTLPVRSGDFVVLWPKRATQRPLIKRLVIRPPEDWQRWHPDGEVVPVIVVEQLNPPRHYRITTDKLAAIHRVLMTFRPGDYEHSAVLPGRPRRVPTRRRATPH